MRLAARPRRLSLGLAPLLVVAAAARAPADDASPAGSPPRLTLERVVGGPPYVSSVEGMGEWRPGHDEGVMWNREKDARTLVAIDAETGARKTLARIEAPAVGPRAAGFRGIGRGAPPSQLWTQSGDVVFVADESGIRRVTIGGGAPLQMTAEAETLSDLRPSPDGKKISFVRNHDLWAAVEEDGKAREVRLTTGGSDVLRNGELDWVYPEELGATTAAWWSPDSTRVAFLRLDETKVGRTPILDISTTQGSTQMQWYPKAGDPNPVPSVGVVSLTGALPVWMDLGASEDVYVPWVTWTPDASRVLVAVLDRPQKRFELRACDPATGAATTWLVEADPAWVDVPPAPRFLGDGKSMLWKSRRGGFWRWYVVEAKADGAAREITPMLMGDAGALLAVDPTAGFAWVEMLTSDGIRTGVLRVRIDGHVSKEVALVTDGHASHSASFSDSGRFFVDRATSSRTPERATLRRGDGSEVRMLGDAATAEWKALALPEPAFGTVPGAEGVPLRTMLVKPRDFDPAKKYPVVVAVYGGPGARVVRDDFGGLWSALLAQEGFLVFSLDGRGSAGRGRDFEAGIKGRLGTLELEDQLRGVEWLKAQPFVDPERIGIWGWSYGGTMTCVALTRSKAFRAGAAVAPVTDWRLYDTIYTERYMGRPEEAEAGYRLASCVAHAKDLSGALLLCHGLADDNVHVQNTFRMTDALVAARKPFDLMIYPGRGHGLGGPATLDVYRRILEHFRKHLLGG